MKKKVSYASSRKVSLSIGSDQLQFKGQGNAKSVPQRGQSVKKVPGGQLLGLKRANGAPLKPTRSNSVYVQKLNTNLHQKLETDESPCSPRRESMRMEKIDELDDVSLEADPERDSILHSVTNSSPDADRRVHTQTSSQRRAHEKTIVLTKFVQMQSARKDDMKEEPDMVT